MTGFPHCRHRRVNLAFWLLGLGSLLWLLVRSGSNPRRLAYPCQQAAAVSGMAFLGHAVAVLGLAGLYRFLRRHTTLTTAAVLGLTLVLVVALTGSGVRPSTASAPGVRGLPSWTSPTAISDVFAVENVPVPECSLDGGTLPATPPCDDPAYALSDAGVDQLLDVMEAHGEFLHRTSSQPDGLIGPDAVVIVKINNQWAQNGTGDGVGRLATNTDVLKGLVWRILQHPDGFTGEVVVAENIQESGAGGWNWTPANAEDREQSIQDVVTAFQGLGYPVSIFDWNPLNYSLISGGSVGGAGYPAGEYAHGNMANAYILLEDPDASGADELSYPKFRTQGGTYVSMRYGVWTGSTYDAGSLVLVNLPVLKAHGMAGGTIAWKNLIGFITTFDTDRRFPGADSWGEMHDYFWGYAGGVNQSYGLLGRQLARIRVPDLNLVDAIWVADDNYNGNANRQDVLLASRDPFALDWYASEYVLYPAIPWPWQDVSAARAGMFRNATRTNQNSAAAEWPGGAFPYMDLLDSYDGDTPSDDEKNQMNVYLGGDAIFADGFESGDTSAWSATVP